MLPLVSSEDKEAQIFGICFTELHAFLLSVEVISYCILFLVYILCLCLFFNKFGYFISSLSLFWIYALPFWFIFLLHELVKFIISWGSIFCIDFEADYSNLKGVVFVSFNSQILSYWEGGRFPASENTTNINRDLMSWFQA